MYICIYYVYAYTRISNQLAYIQECMVCMYACVHIGVYCWRDGVSLRGSNTDGNPSYGSVGWIPLVWVCHVLFCSHLRPGRPLEQVSHLLGCTRVCIYACTYMGAFVCVCVSGTE